MPEETFIISNAQKVADILKKGGDDLKQAYMEMFQEMHQAIREEAAKDWILDDDGVIEKKTFPKMRVKLVKGGNFVTYMGQITLQWLKGHPNRLMSRTGNLRNWLRLRRSWSGNQSNSKLSGDDGMFGEINANDTGIKFSIGMFPRGAITNRAAKGSKFGRITKTQSTPSAYGFYHEIGKNYVKPGGKYHRPGAERRKRFFLEPAVRSIMSQGNLSEYHTRFMQTALNRIEARIAA